MERCILYDLANGKPDDEARYRHLGVVCWLMRNLTAFVDNGDGTYTITTKATEDKACVAVSSDSTDSGANIVQWTCNGKDSQKWKISVDTIKDGCLNWTKYLLHAEERKQQLVSGS